MIEVSFEDDFNITERKFWNLSVNSNNYHNGTVIAYSLEPSEDDFVSLDSRSSVDIFAADLAPTSSSSPESFDNNWWALSALLLVLFTAAGNILVCLAICWERRLQNVTNYFLMSLAVTDLLVAVLVMPLGILTLVKGYFPLTAVWCLAWICLDVLLCTASIMHLCTISIDRYLSLRYPMKFGRNKTRRRVTLKILSVWILSTAMSLPLSLMYSKSQQSVLKDGICQIPDPLYKLIGSIVSFYIPLLVMLITYALTVKLLARQQKGLNLSTTASPSPFNRRRTWRRFVGTTRPGSFGSPTALLTNRSAVANGVDSSGGTPHHLTHSMASNDTDLVALDTHDLWIQDSCDPAPSAMSALHQFGTEMLKLSKGLGSAAFACTPSAPPKPERTQPHPDERDVAFINHRLAQKKLSPTTNSTECEKLTEDSYTKFGSSSDSNFRASLRRSSRVENLRSLSDDDEPAEPTIIPEACPRSRSSEDTVQLPPPCTCPFFGEKTSSSTAAFLSARRDVLIVSTDSADNVQTKVDIEANKLPKIKSEFNMATLNPIIEGYRRPSQRSIVTWEEPGRFRRGSSFRSTKTSIISTDSQIKNSLTRSCTIKSNKSGGGMAKNKNHLSPFSLQRCNTFSPSRSVRSHHSRNSSVVSRNSSRHGRIIKLEQKATKVLGIVFFTFVFLWAPFFILNTMAAFWDELDSRISPWVMDFATWLGYASSMVNPIFYTIFNKIFRQAFKRVLTCGYCKKTEWKPRR